MRLLDANLRPEAGDGPCELIEPVALPIRIAERRPHFTVCREVEPPGHHADNRIPILVEHHRLADDSRVRAKTPLPQAVAQDDQSWTAYQVFFSNERTTEHRPHAEGSKHAVGDPSPTDQLGPIAAGRGVRRAGVDADVLEDPIHLEPVLIHRI